MGLKDLFIIILSVFFLLSLIFNFNKENEIDYREKEIEKLKEDNKRLYSQNDSLIILNDKIDKEVITLTSLVEEQREIIKKTEEEINKLIKRRNEISNNINRLPANDVADEFSDYIRRYEKNRNSSN
jgi:chromosome segregation ATPase